MFIIVFFSMLSKDYCQENKCGILENKKQRKQYEEALSFTKQKSYGEAIQILKKIIETDPNNGDALYLMGEIYVTRTDKNLKAGQKYLAEALTICPEKYYKAYSYIGEIMFWNEEYKGAIKNIEKYLSFNEKIKNNKDYDRAEKMLNKAKFYDNIYSNPVPFEPVLVKGISTEADEYLPIITPDGEHAFFTRRYQLPESDFKLVDRGPSFVEKFSYSIFENSAFDKGKPLSNPFNKSQNEGGATITIDNRYLYYTVCNYNATGYYNCDIYSSEYQNNTWQEIKNLGAVINNENTWEAQPSISSDGNTLYFVSDRTDGIGGYDIYYSTKDENGNWTKAKNMGQDINTDKNEKSPFIHSDSHTLYFTSDGWEGLGGYDIFMSKMEDNNKWHKPKNIGYPINSKEDDLGFFVSTDGKTAYFCSNKLKGNGGWDMYSFELYKEVRPEKVLFVRGEITDENKNPKQAEIELKNITTNEVKKIEIDSETGKYAAIVLMKDDFIMTVKEGDNLPSVKYFSKEDSLVGKPQKVDVELKPIKVNESYKINDIFFNTNSFELTLGSKAVLDEFIKYLLKSQSISLSVNGYTDNMGIPENNLMLSENRAKAVCEYLIGNGIEANRLSHKGFGDADPIDSNETEAGRAKNRRTEFVITKE